MDRCKTLQYLSSGKIFVEKNRWKYVRGVADDDDDNDNDDVVNFDVCVAAKEENQLF